MTKVISICLIAPLVVLLLVGLIGCEASVVKGGKGGGIRRSAGGYEEEEKEQALQAEASHSRRRGLKSKKDYDDYYYYDDHDDYYYDDFAGDDFAGDDFADDDDDNVSSKIGCFSGDSTVVVLNKGTLSMKDLQVGDRVGTGNMLKPYQTVYAFGHWDLVHSMDYYQISSSKSKRPLEISGDHLLYVQGNTGPVRADSVQVGDVLHYAKHNTFATVTGIVKGVTKRGMYAPLTTDGTILVDGIVASTYVDISTNSDEIALLGGVTLPMTQAAVIHVWLSPLRLFCAAEATCTMSSSFCNEILHDKTTGLNTYVRFGMDFVLWVEQKPASLQIIAAILPLLLVSAFYAVESFFFGLTTITTTLLAVGIVAIVLFKTNNIRVRITAQHKKQKLH